MPENGWCLAAKYGCGYRMQQLNAAPSVSNSAQGECTWGRIQR